MREKDELIPSILKPGGHPDFNGEESPVAFCHHVEAWDHRRG